MYRSFKSTSSDSREGQTERGGVKKYLGFNPSLPFPSPRWLKKRILKGEKLAVKLHFITTIKRNKKGRKRHLSTLLESSLYRALSEPVETALEPFIQLLLQQENTRVKCFIKPLDRLIYLFTVL